MPLPLNRPLVVIDKPALLAAIAFGRSSQMEIRDLASLGKRSQRRQSPQIKRLSIDLRPHMPVAAGAGNLNHAGNRAEVVGGGLSRWPVVRAQNAGTLPKIIWAAPNADHDHRI